MYDHDIFTADDFMGNGTTNSQGQFSFGGTTNEFFEIEPRIHIYHDCNDGINTCQRKLTIVIPKKYISYSSTPSQYLVYDTGIIELTNTSDEESRDCIH
uniref:Transthyretin-like family protein n=1 Tax=Acrobeloides nanus TaxID=290746 RepID=A0A914EMI9_9BILA